jgi:beta-lactamase regulating signal transducer with metallopeptidase domain
VIAWLVETLIAVTLLMVMVLALRGPVSRSFGAGWAYALWAVPALRLIVPPLPQLAPDLVLPPVVTFIPTAAELAAPLPVEAGAGPWVPFMLAMWAGGAVIFLTLQWLTYRVFVRRLDETSRPARPPLFGGIRTWISEAVEGPMALGLIDRRIVLPGDFSRRYTPVERRLALEHELVHHRRGDIWWNVAAMVVLALFWFNPVAWMAFRAFRADQELACDAAVARKSSMEERCEYARALVKSASHPGLIAASALNPAGQLKQRLRMMRGHRSSVARSAGGVSALTVFAALGLALSSPAVTVEMAAPFQAAAAPLATQTPAPPVAPLQVAAVESPTIVVTGQRPRRAAARSPYAGLRSEPLAIASAQAPSTAALAELPSLLPQLRRAMAAAGRPGHSVSFAVMTANQPGAAAVQVSQTRVVRLPVPHGAPERFQIVTRDLQALDMAELERVVAEAVQIAASAEDRVRAEKLQEKLKELKAKGGSTGGGITFDTHIQTIHQGE